MAIDVANLTQLIKLARSSSDEVQMQMLATGFKAFGPKLLPINEQQAGIISGLLVDQNALNTDGVPDDEVFVAAIAKFHGAATPAVPLRIICSNCGTIRRVN